MTAGFREMQVTSIAAEVLSLHLEAPTLLKTGRADVVRARALSRAGSQSVVIKQFGPQYGDHFRRERAGLRYLSDRVEGKFVPRLLAEDERTRTLLVEDIAINQPLAELLAGDDVDAAIAALVVTAQRMGTLHGVSQGSAAALAAAGAGTASDGLILKSAIPATVRFLTAAHEARTGMPLASAVDSELREALTALATEIDRADCLRTMTLGDVAPSNVLLTEGRPIFVDLEYCGYRSAFYDAIFWRCVCPFPCHVVERMDAGYREGLSAVGVAIDDAQFVENMLLFAAHRVFWTMSWNMHELFVRDREFVPGIGARAMLRRYLDAYLALSKRCAAEADALPRLAARLAQDLSSLWPDADPAFELACFQIRPEDQVQRGV